MKWLYPFRIGTITETGGNPLQQALGEMKLSFDKLVNFRDMGGLKTEDGRILKTGILYRSDDLSRMTENDLKNLDECRIKVICDLRSPKEHKTKQSRLLPHGRFRVMNMPLHLEGTQASKRQIIDFFFGRAGAEHFKKFSRAYYRYMAVESTLEIKKIIDLLAQEQNLPVLIHCTAGKDRTGFISALIQLIAGVPYPIVVQEYLVTNDLYKSRLEKLSKVMSWLTLFQVKPERIKLILMANKECLDEVFSDMLQKYGSIDRYLIRACGIDQSTLRKLRELILE